MDFGLELAGELVGGVVAVGRGDAEVEDAGAGGGEGGFGADFDIGAVVADAGVERADQHAAGAGGADIGIAIRASWPGRPRE